MAQVPIITVIRKASKYLEKSALYSDFVHPPPNDGVEIIVAIPAYAESSLIQSLESLNRCRMPPVGVEVIVGINHPENAPEELIQQNIKIARNATKWAEANSTSNFGVHIIGPVALPQKHAGAGLARKVVMDEAVRRLGKAEDGIIAAFDADATCDGNYLTAIYWHFRDNPKHLACTVYFEHGFDQNAEAITQYELHLRYMKNALAYSGHPYALHTVGSSMAVRASAYIAQGGMNKRQAGEDFYFLQKLMMAGEVGELNNTVVRPSSRKSYRVPFGTGRAMTEMLEAKTSTYFTYNFESYRLLHSLLKPLKKYWLGQPPEVDNKHVVRFLELISWSDRLDEIRNNTTTYSAFRKRFYRWFNAFMVIRWLHYLRDAGYDDQSVTSQAGQLLAETGEAIEGKNTLACLAIYRASDKKRPMHLHRPFDFL